MGCTEKKNEKGKKEEEQICNIYHIPKFCTPNPSMYFVLSSSHVNKDNSFNVWNSSKISLVSLKIYFSYKDNLATRYPDRVLALVCISVGLPWRQWRYTSLQKLNPLFSMLTGRIWIK